MTPGERTMPTVTATWLAGSGWVVRLPGDRERTCSDDQSVITLVRREACGSAIRWIGGPTPRPASRPDLARQLGTESRDVVGVPIEAPGPDLVAPSRTPSPHAPVAGVRTSRRRRLAVASTS